LIAHPHQINQSVKPAVVGSADMKNFKEFLSESINISGDFNGNLYLNSEPEQKQVGESYLADVVWEGNLYRFEMVAKSGVPSKQELGEELQGEYPGAVVHQIYPAEQKNINIKSKSRYHPSKLEWL
jgi:hypothetical protein